MIDESPKPETESEPIAALRVSLYDRVSSMLLALLILVGSTVSLMFIIWLSNRIHTTTIAVPVVMEEVGTGDGSPEGGGGTDGFDVPASDEVIQESVPEPDLKDTLSLVASAVKDRADLLDDPALIDRPNRGLGGGSGGGIGTGRGKGVGPGTGKGGPARHWEMRFPRDNTLEAYAKQLDFFGIELGVLMPGNKVEYASKLSDAKPTRRSGPADQEKRYYLTWRRGELEQADRELLQKAGIESQGRLILKFLTPQVEGTLVSLEKTKAGGNLTRIANTVFGIQLTADGGYSFYIIDQTLKQ